MSEQKEPSEWQTKEFWKDLFAGSRDERVDEVTRNATQWMYWIMIAIFIVSAIYYLAQSRPIGWVLVAILLFSAGQYWWLIGRHNIEVVDEYTEYIRKRPYLYLVGSLSWFPISALIYYLVNIDQFEADYFIWTAITVVNWVGTPVIQFARGAFSRDKLIATVIIAIISGLIGFVLGYSDFIPEWGMAIIFGVIFIACSWFGYMQLKKRPW